VRADEYLEQVKELDSKIDNKRDEERELWALATSITQNYSGMPHGSGQSDQMTDIVKKIIDARNRTNAQIDLYVGTKQDVINHIERLPRKQYDVLYWLYIKKRERREKGQKWYYTWSEVAENLGCSEENIRKTRRRGIKNLQKILDSEQRLLEVE
jgi:DNA-directed RNA polymerase specialized sigma subunit